MVSWQAMRSRYCSHPPPLPSQLLWNGCLSILIARGFWWSMTSGRGSSLGRSSLFGSSSLENIHWCVCDMYAYVRVCVACMCGCMHACVHVWMCVCMSAFVSACVYVCACMPVYMCACIRACLHAVNWDVLNSLVFSSISPCPFFIPGNGGTESHWALLEADHFSCSQLTLSLCLRVLRKVCIHGGGEDHFFMAFCKPCDVWQLSVVILKWLCLIAVFMSLHHCAIAEASRWYSPSIVCGAPGSAEQLLYPFPVIYNIVCILNDQSRLKAKTGLSPTPFVKP